eukprot:SAG11_NODE_875_length_6768_cov_2.183686_4_plen_131_part_00
MALARWLRLRVGFGCVASFSAKKTSGRASKGSRKRAGPTPKKGAKGRAAGKRSAGKRRVNYQEEETDETEEEEEEEEYDADDLHMAAAEGDRSMLRKILDAGIGIDDANEVWPQTQAVPIKCFLMQTEID